MTNEDVQRWACEVASWREAKGFVTSWENVTQKLFLTVCELAEAGECVRRGQWETFQQNGKPEGFPMEIADAAIRLFDLAGSLQPTMPPFTPYPVAQCSKDTMLDVLMDLTGDLWVSSSNVHMDRKDTLGIGIMRVLGKLHTISEVIGFDLQAEVAAKHEFNKGRPYRHGTVNVGGA
jgi:hypothetical protein